MLLKEILLDANLLVPNTISDESKVRWLNELQGQLYRDFAFPNVSTTFTAETGKNLFTLPTDCSRERITSVIVGETNYEYRSIDQDVTDHCWTVMEERELFIYPTPTQTVIAFLNYRPRPQRMTIDMQEEKPDFPEDFHEVLVYGIATRIARAEQDTNRAVELKATFDELHEKAQKELRPARNKKVQMNRTWR